MKEIVQKVICELANGILILNVRISLLDLFLFIFNIFLDGRPYVA